MGFQFIMPGKIVYGEGALENAKPLLKDFGKKHLLLQTDLWYASEMLSL